MCKLNGFTEICDHYTENGFNCPYVIKKSIGQELSSLGYCVSKMEPIPSIVDQCGELNEVNYPLILGCYYPKINSHIGEGTYGHVYSIQSTVENNETVAVKFQNHSTGTKGWDSWKPGSSYMDIPMNPFKDEIYLQAKLSSKGLAPVIFNAWEEEYNTVWGNGNQDVLIMKRLHETISQVTVKDPTFGIHGDVIRLIDEMHMSGVFHGDLHAGNIMIDSDGKPFIIDLGKSKSIPDGTFDREWCIMHDLMNLYQTLPNKSGLKRIIKDKAKSIDKNFRVLETCFDFKE